MTFNVLASKEKFASYATPYRQSQSGSKDQKGRISKDDPSMLRFVLINAAHMVIKYLKIVRMYGNNHAMIAMRILAETIWTMLSRRILFYDPSVNTEKKMESMRIRSLHPNVSKNVIYTIKLIKNQNITSMSDKLFSWRKLCCDIVLCHLSTINNTRLITVPFLNFSTLW